jgi:GTP cyclohydrolase I
MEGLMMPESRINGLSLATRQRLAPSEPKEGIDLPRVERAVREILLAIGGDPDRDGLLDTPKRVAKSYVELFRGLREDPAVHLRRTFTQAHGESIILRDIEFSSICEHHLLPFMGKAHVAYTPDGGHVVGLSKLARTVEVFARRPQVQERMTDQIADALVEHLNPQGVAVIVEANHLCMKLRGVNKTCSSMQTFALRGSYKVDRALGSQIVNLICNSRR